MSRFGNLEFEQQPEERGGQQGMAVEAPPEHDPAKLFRRAPVRGTVGFLEGVELGFGICHG